MPLTFTSEEFETLAALEHARWSDWMLYLLSKCSHNENGTATIPQWAVERWVRQANTPYEKLSAEEQNSDRNEVRRYLRLINAMREWALREKLAEMEKQAERFMKEHPDYYGGSGEETK